MLCVKYQRKLSKGSTISLNGKTFFIKQDKFNAKTDVTILLSERIGLKALINDTFYPITMLSDDKTNSTVKNSHMQVVIKELIKKVLLSDAKAA